MKINKIIIDNPIVGRENSFIYCLYITKPIGVVYIGETRARNGALGRLSGHMQVNDGTFLQKCKEKKNIDIDDIECDITMLTFDLSDYNQYCGDVNGTYRRALEYFVHGFMEEYSLLDTTYHSYDVVSWTNIANRLCNDEEIQDLAERIASAFYKELPFGER